MIKLSQEQENVINLLFNWYRNSKEQYITIGGYAGTGKTTLLSIFSKKIHKDDKKIKIAFVSYTGKAARVLRSKLMEADALFDKDYSGTIHSLIYSPIENDNGEITGWKRKEAVKYDLVVIDEASMIDEHIWNDLTFYNLPIIAVGDHGQLPPIRGSFSLMSNPQLKLEEIHRQAADNPIIKISVLARKYGIIPHKDYGNNVLKLNRRKMESKLFVDKLVSDFDEKTLVLCGFNVTRVKLNKYIRKKLGYVGEYPEVGDRAICLRNNHEKEIFNGMAGTIKKIEATEKDWAKATIQMDGEEKEYEGSIYLPQFNNTEPFNFTKFRKNTLKGDLFDYGYAITVHKAQGSQNKRVILFEERFSKMSDDEWSRWLYTAVTRAEEELIILGY